MKINYNGTELDTDKPYYVEVYGITVPLLLRLGTYKDDTPKFSLHYGYAFFVSEEISAPKLKIFFYKNKCFGTLPELHHLVTELK